MKIPVLLFLHAPLCLNVTSGCIQVSESKRHRLEKVFPLDAQTGSIQKGQPPALQSNIKKGIIEKG